MRNIHDTSLEATKCDVCEEVFMNRRQLMTHKQKHSEPMVCDVCGKSFFRKDCLRIHMNEVHAKGEEECQCQICGLKFPCSSRLRSHLNKRHNPEKQIKTFSCSYCAKVFSDKESWSSHLNTHTKQTLYRCEMCNITFLRRAVLYLHNRRQHGLKGGLKYSCRYCKEKFKTTHFLFLHVKSDHFDQDLAHPKPIMKKCPYCPKLFARDRRLKLEAHVNSHTGNKPFTCLICGTSFADRSNLNAHLKVVHKSGLFKCEFCSEMLTNGYEFKLHLDSHKKLENE